MLDLSHIQSLGFGLPLLIIKKNRKIKKLKGKIGIMKAAFIDRDGVLN